MQKNGINTAEIKKILPHGSVKEVAKRSKMSIYTVSRVLNGSSNNPFILKEIEAYILEVQATTKRINALAVKAICQ